MTEWKVLEECGRFTLLADGEAVITDTRVQGLWGFVRGVAAEQVHDWEGEEVRRLRDAVIRATGRAE